MLKTERFYDYRLAMNYIKELEDKGIKYDISASPYYENIEDCYIEVDCWVVSYEG